MSPKDKEFLNKIYEKYYGKDKAKKPGHRLGLKSIIRDEVKKGKNQEQIVEFLCNRNTGKDRAYLKKYVKYIVDYRLPADRKEK